MNVLGLAMGAFRAFRGLKMAVMLFAVAIPFAVALRSCTSQIQDNMTALGSERVRATVAREKVAVLRKRRGEDREQYGRNLAAHEASCRSEIASQETRLRGEAAAERAKLALERLPDVAGEGQCGEHSTIVR